MAGLKRRQLVVGLMAGEHGDEGEHSVTLTLADQLRAELEGGRVLRGAQVTQHPMHLQGLFGWAAMVREGKFTGKFSEFREVCAYVSDPDEDDDGEDVDPTSQAAPSGSA